MRRLTIGGAPVVTDSYLYFDIVDHRRGQGRGLMIDRVNQGWDRSVVARPRAAASPPLALPPATTGVLWSVSMRPAAEGRARGVTLALAGDYRGTGDDYPRAGFRFTETGSFFRVGSVYRTPRGWRAPPQATDADPAAAGAAAEATYQVTIDPGRRGGMRPTLTFMGCGDGVVDRYEKLAADSPRISGRGLAAVWRNAVAAGVFRTVPAR